MDFAPSKSPGKTFLKELPVSFAIFSKCVIFALLNPQTLFCEISCEIRTALSHNNSKKCFSEKNELWKLIVTKKITRLADCVCKLPFYHRPPLNHKVICEKECRTFRKTIRQDYPCQSLRDTIAQIKCPKSQVVKWNPERPNGLTFQILGLWLWL